MATHPIDLLFNGSVKPLDGNCFFAPYSAETGATTQDPMVLHMVSVVVSMIKGTVRIPNIYVGTPVLEIMWTSETTTNTVDFKFRHRTIGAGEQLEISTAPTELEDNANIDNLTGPTNANELVISTQALTTTDLTAGQLMYYELERDGVSDDRADTITVWAATFLFNDA